MATQGSRISRSYSDRCEQAQWTIAAMLFGIALPLVLGHDAAASGALLTGTAQMVAGVIADFGIGIVTILLGWLEANC